MRVNGKYKGDIECMFIFEDSLKKGDYGEKIFYDYFKDKLEKQDGIVHDFKIKNTDIYIELKSDYYDIDKTENFFIEKYSDKNRNKYGGPWQALLNNNKYYIYFFVKNKILFIFFFFIICIFYQNFVPIIKIINIVRNYSHNNSCKKCWKIQPVHKPDN